MSVDAWRVVGAVLIVAAGALLVGLRWPPRNRADRRK